MGSSRTPLLFFAATTVLLLLNYPWLSLFSSPQLLFGLPPLLLYLFGLWLAFILVVRWLVEPYDDQRPTADDDAQEPPNA